MMAKGRAIPKSKISTNGKRKSDSGNVGRSSKRGNKENDEENENININQNERPAIVLTSNSRSIQESRNQISEARKNSDDDEDSTSSASISLSIDGASVNRNATGNQIKISEHRQGQSNGSVRATITSVTAATHGNNMEGDTFSAAPSSITIRTSKNDDGYVKGVNLGNDPSQVITLKDQIKRVMFPHCKILHTANELDDIGPGSFGGILMDKCNVNVLLRVGFWNTVKVEAKRYLNNLRQQVNTKLKEAYWKYQHLPGAYDLDHIIKVGREDKVAYTWFVNTYLRKAVTRNVQSGLLKSAPSKVFTIGDEAITLWYLENSWEVWAHMKANTNKNAKSLIDPKYTVRGDRAGNGKDAGWSEEGKQRYNDLFDMIERSRNTRAGKEFDEHYVLSKKPDDFKVKKDRQSSSGRPVMAKNTLSALCATSTAVDYNNCEELEEEQEMDALDGARPYTEV